MDNKFIYCFDLETKNKLEQNGFKFMKQVQYNGKDSYLFMNTGSKMNFADCEVQFSNKLMF